jgi:N-acyl-D-amino-acid deacylase
LDLQRGDNIPIGLDRTEARRALDAGAVGFATSKSPTHVGHSGKPVPSRMSDFDEIRSLASAMGEAGHGIMQPTIGRELFLRKFAEIAREIHRPITYTALLAGMNGPGGHRGPLEASQEKGDEGLNTIPQVTCRPLNFEFHCARPKSSHH